MAKDNASDNKVAAVRASVDLINALQQLPWLTAHQAAIIVGTSASSIRRALGTGHLAGVRVGRGWRVRPSALDQWLGASTSETGRDLGTPLVAVRRQAGRS